MSFVQISEMRSHTCGQLRESNIGQKVLLYGWVAHKRDFGNLIFIDLRDRYGVTQIVLNAKKNGTAHDLAAQLKLEFVIAVKGEVYIRPKGTENLEIETGNIEVHGSELKILSEAKTLPFQLNEEAEISEALSLKYRYLELRRSRLQRNLLIRHRFLSKVREFLNQRAFIEVETPILYKSTPEGARDFVVPSRLNPSRFYALPQSPQMLKQLLMVAGMDRYFQIARCFRDEDFRADRQPEFSQIDIEASFLTVNTFLQWMEEMMVQIWKELKSIHLSLPFPQLTYLQAIQRFGSDHPDLRFGLELIDLTPIFKEGEIVQIIHQLQSSGKKAFVQAIVVPQRAEEFSEKELNILQGKAASLGGKHFFWMKVQSNGEWYSSKLAVFSETEKKLLQQRLDLKSGDLVLILVDVYPQVYSILGIIRSYLGDFLNLISPQSEPYFVWIVDFPLFQYNELEQRYEPCHHLFTAPQPQFFSDLKEGKNLDQMLACAYDLVVNGVEVGGGSVRLNQLELQNAVFQVMGISLEEAKEKFGFFLEALEYGAPPHMGIALGVERLTALLADTMPIRDVIAFPKSRKGQCLMSQCPSHLEAEQLKELGISCIHQE